MSKVDVELVQIKEMSTADLAKFLKDNGMTIKLDEARKVSELLKRDPTLTELHIFNTQWSEHTSYKSSKDVLKLLPTTGPTVIMGPKEDAGIAYFTEHEGERYGIVMSHESHNHPSQVVPFEGAATGIGGNVRDVLCMGSRVIACADPLRFGNPDGKHKNKVKYIANGVIDGIAGYGNPLGIPVIAGDVYFNDSFDDNCLVNVVTLGVLKEKDIIHSYAPKDAAGYDIIVVGKATDNSGFGGAAFASVILDEDDRESNRGAVQVPDPFLKNVLIRATEAVFKEVREKNIPVGFKDMGAGGIMCATTELTSVAGYGASIDVDKIHVSMHDLPPYIIMCSETQERFTWVCPPSFSETILKIYNEDFELPNVAEGARASIVGKVTKEQDYVLRHKGKVICDTNVCLITEGIKYDRKAREHATKRKELKEPTLSEPTDYNGECLKVLKHPNVASKAACYKHYDSEVQGLTVLRPGEADAGVQTPIAECKSAIALSVDSNPRYCRIDPYLGGVNAVAESMRNVASVGAYPIALTDCLNYGNPEKEESFHDFKEGVKGISDTAKALSVKGTKDPVPYISGNVSFYNESAAGKSVDPSAIIGCLGKIDDVSNVINMKIKKEGSTLFMIGERKDELGGSVYYDVNNSLGKNVPNPDLSKEKEMIHKVVEAIDKRLLLSCHDVSDGGILVTLAEMILGGEADGKVGAVVNIDFSELPNSKVLFSESSGFIFEVEDSKVEAVKKLFGESLIELGSTSGDKLVVRKKEETIVDLDISKMKEAWTSGFVQAIR